jgi:hypothetical protein
MGERLPLDQVAPPGSMGAAGTAEAQELCPQSRRPDSSAGAESVGEEARRLQPERKLPSAEPVGAGALRLQLERKLPSAEPVGEEARRPQLERKILLAEPVGEGARRLQCEIFPFPSYLQARS